MAPGGRQSSFPKLGPASVNNANNPITDITAIALNERGANTAVKLGLPVEIGKPNTLLDSHWQPNKSLVLVMALPIAVRLLAKRALEKHSDPIVLVMDEAGKFIIPVLGGHRGANVMAKELASRAQGTPVVTTASDIAGIGAIDALSGFVATGDIAKLIDLMLDGNDPIIEQNVDWPGPVQLTNGTGPAKVIISDARLDLSSLSEPTVQLIPPSLVVGIGCSSDASERDVEDLIATTFDTNRLDRRAVAKIATIEQRKNHPALLAQNIPIEAFHPEVLKNVLVPNGSVSVESFVGTSSVCEAGALLSSDSGELIVSKVKNSKVTLAVARRKAKGHLKLVGLGPGTSMMRTPQAVEAIVTSEVVIGYRPYVTQCSDLLSPNQHIIRSPIGQEVKRAEDAIEFAMNGRSVAIVCSGDPEVFAMASVTFEALAAYCAEKQIASFENHLKITIVPGITAGLGGGALVGAPLGHDHAYLSLSDLLTPWEVIEKRINAFGMADVVVIIYNPQSLTRTWQLPKAIELLSQYRPKDTPLAVVRNVGREDETKSIFYLGDFDPTLVDMNSLVIVGSSATKNFNGYLFTPRGYKV